MNRIKMLSLALVAVMLSFTGMAGPTSTLCANRSKKGDPVTLGKWHVNYDKCKKYAEQNKIPLIAVWSNGDACGHCVLFENAVNHANFKKWMKTSGMVFLFIHSGDKSQAPKEYKVDSKYFHWVRGKNTSYPFIRVYWPAGKVDIHTVGDTVDKLASGAKAANNAVSYFKGKLKNYKYNPTPADNGGTLDSGNLDLEVEEGAGSVQLHISRPAAAQTLIGTNTVRVISADKATTNDVVVIWDKAQSSTNISIAVNKSLKAGAEMPLQLISAAGKTVNSSVIKVVAEPPNSPANPRWMGERTETTLGWGEWTMDIDAATNKVNAYNAGKTPLGASGKMKLGASEEKAYTLMLVGGSQWCPDCVRADEHLFDTAEFRTWAAETHKVACVAVDVPPFAAGLNEYPCLLNSLHTTDTNKWYCGASGAAYVSRKMRTPEDLELAEEILERNLSYVNNTVTNGGFCLPENVGSDGNTSVWKTGVPCLILLRGDGTVAGRLFQFSNSTSAMADGSVSAATMVKRLDEMLMQDADASEEVNDSISTTTMTIGKREESTGNSLSFTDVADVFKLNSEETFGKRLLVSVEPDGACLPDTMMQVDLYQVTSGGLMRNIGCASGVVEAGKPLQFDTVALSSSNCYLKVSYPVDSSAYSTCLQFALTNKDSTVCGYRLKTDFIICPAEVAATDVIDDFAENPYVSVELESGKIYRITNLDETALDPSVLAKVPETDDRYTAQTNGTVSLKVTAGSVTSQLWNPGTVGFAAASAFTPEPAGAAGKEVYSIRLVRNGGLSGTATAKVSFNAEKSSKLDGLFELGDDFSDTLTWEEGDVSEKTVDIAILGNSFADGDQVLVFDVECGGDAAAGIVQMRLTLRDNDKKVPGRLAIVEAADVPFAKAMNVVVRAGDDVSFDVAREEGADGEVGVTLSTTAGSLSDESLVWPGRDSVNRTVALSGLDGSKSKATVTMKSVSTSKVDSNRRILTVEVIDADAPGFDVSKVVVDAKRYLPIGDYEISLDSYATDETTVKKYSGTLAPGLSWKFADGILKISGVPNKAGEFNAVFRAYNGKKAGMVVSVVVKVADPVVSGGGAGGNAPLNPSVAVSRTFEDVPVFSAYSSRLAGVLTLTIPRTGRCSAKYRTELAKTITLSSASWLDIDGEGALQTDLRDATDRYMLSVTAFANGEVSVELVDPDRDVVCGDGGILRKYWSAANTAADFGGYYTVSMPRTGMTGGQAFARGDAYMTLDMSKAAALKSGKFAYAGIYPNGKAFSGSATITPMNFDEELGCYRRALLPVLVGGASDMFAGALQITPGASDPKACDMDEKGEHCTGRCYYENIRRSIYGAPEATMLWRHTEKSALASCEAEYGAYGTYYTTKENFANCCMQAIGNTSLKFFALGGFEADLGEDIIERFGKDDLSAIEAARAIATVNVKYVKKVTKKGKKSVTTYSNSIASGNTKTLPLSFSLATGVVSGSFKLGGITMTYKGVVMPHWGNSDCEACGYGAGSGGADAKLRPFISGAVWFNDTFEYEDDNGKTRMITVRRGCPFSVGEKAGQ